MNPLVAIVGRPNVGKSTLFNRVVGKRQAIVSAEPGTTRDRVLAAVTWQGKSFTLVDTGGLVTAGEDPLLQAVQQQVKVAVRQAEAILFVVDAQTGPIPEDMAIANLLRPRKHAVLLVANKAEGKTDRLATSEFYALGLGDPRPISALHGQGVGEVMDEVSKLLPTGDEDRERGIRIVFLGRQNVGKSSFLNRLLGEERVLVTSDPGTTRDAVDTVLTWDAKEITLVDTAGIRRRGRVRPGVEEYSVLRALAAIQEAEIGLLLLDAGEGILAQDTHIAGYVRNAGKGLIILVNKWDLVANRPQAKAQYTAAIRQAFRFVPYVPLFFTSALTGEGVEQVLPAALEVYRQRRLQIPAQELNRVLQEAVSQHPPPTKGGKKLLFNSLRQIGAESPSFVFEVNDPALVHFSYRRYLENRLRQAFGFAGTPIAIEFRRKKKGAPRKARAL